MSSAIRRTIDQRHPPCARARWVRRLRALRHVRGWGRLVGRLVPPGTGGAFAIENDGLAFAGDLGSYIDRQTYLFGQYEEQSIAVFLARVPEHRRGAILDIGANVGTHSLAFARQFEVVHAFEPNPALWAQFECNMAINGFDHVTLHRVGVGDEDTELPLHLIDAPNYGLGTFSTVEQYAMPLKRIGVCRVVNGDEYLRAQGIERVDAIKIDVQGFEPQVLRGLAATLNRNRPVVWFEVGAVTQDTIRGASDLQALFPYPFTVHRIAPEGWLFHSTTLKPASGALPVGDYLVAPAVT